ncbi:MAG: MFS transporter, partial [Marinilabiliales bacterium]
MRKKKSSTAYILSVSAVHLIHDIYAAFFAPVIPILVEKLSLNYTSIGIISAARTLPSFFNPLLGKLLDKWQTRVFLVISPIVTSVMMSLIGYANSAYALFFILLISGFSSSLFHLQGPPSIRAVSGNKVGRGMSWFMFGGELSRT